MAVESAFLQGASIAIIGAGALGSLTAYRLAQAGASVTVIERTFPGAGTTGSSFAWLNSFGKTPREYHRLNARSIREHQDLAQELNGDWAHVHGGVAWELLSDEQRSQRLKDKIHRLHQWGYRVEPLTPEQVTRDLEPDLEIDPELVEHVYYAPIEGWIDGVAMCHGAVTEAVRRYGARLVTGTVTGIEIGGGAVTGVKLESGETVPADAVINATGPEAGRIAEMAGADLPVERQFGLLVTTKPAPAKLRAVVHALGNSVRPEGGSRLMLHGEGYDSLIENGESVDVSHPFPKQAIERAADVVPNLRGINPEGIRVGVRPMPKDGLPIIGFDPEVNGFYHLVMHSAVTLSAGVSSLVVEDLLNIEPPELEHYRPARFSEKGAAAVHATDE